MLEFSAISKPVALVACYVRGDDGEVNTLCRIPKAVVHAQQMIREARATTALGHDIVARARLAESENPSGARSHMISHPGP